MTNGSRIRMRILLGGLAVAALVATTAARARAGTPPEPFFNPQGGSRNVALLEAGATVVSTSSSSGSSTPAAMLNFDSADAGWTTTSITGQFTIFRLAAAATWVIDRVRVLSRATASTARVKDFAIDVSTTDTAASSFTTVATGQVPNVGTTQEFVFPQPVVALYVRYRPLTNWGSTTNILTQQLKVMSGQHTPSSTVTFENLSTDADDDIVSWLWQFGDGGTSTAASPSHTYASPGAYPVSLTATDAEGHVGTYSTTVRVLAAPAVSFTATPPTPSEGQSTNFCDTTTDADGSIIRRTWSWGDGTPGITTTNVCAAHAFGDNLTYTVALTVVDDQETTAAGSSTIAPHNVAPTVNVGANRRWVSGERLTFGVSVTDPGWRDTRTCAWDHGDGTTRSICSSFDHTYSAESAARSFTATLTATDDDGGVGSDSLNVAVFPQMFERLPSASVDAVGLDWSSLVNKLVVTKGGNCVNKLALVALDGTSTPEITGDLTTGCAETKIAVSQGTGDFGLGDIFLGNGTPGGIVRVRMDASGAVTGIDNPWVTLPTALGRFNGGLAFDTTGSFDGDLLAALSDGRVFRIAADRTFKQVAALNKFLEGASVAGSDFGPASGCLLTTDGSAKHLIAVCPDGSVSTLATLPSSAALTSTAFVPSAGTLFYGDDRANRLYRADAQWFTGIAGRALAATGSGGEVWDIAYDAASGSYIATVFTLAVHGGTADAIQQLAFVSALSSPDSGLAPSTATALVGDAHTVTASIRDAQGAPIAGVELTFEVTTGPNAGTTGAATTRDDGTATFTYTGTGAGTDTVVARSSSARTRAVTVTWLRRPTTLTADAALVTFAYPAAPDPALSARATLRDRPTGAPVEGRTVSFFTRDPLTGERAAVCTDETDSSGVAACEGPAELLAIVLGEGYEATFEGDDLYEPASAKAPLARVVVEE